MGGGDPQSQVAAPGMPNQQRPLPPEPVKHAHHVLDGLCHRERAFDGRRLEPTLLKGSDPKLGLELGRELV
jgi:hypothetical protein